MPPSSLPLHKHPGATSALQALARTETAEHGTALTPTCPPCFAKNTNTYYYYYYYSLLENLSIYLSL